MEDEQIGNVPSQCPVCNGDLLVTRLQCSSCGTEVNGTFTLINLATLKEPHASLIEMFLRARGNMKEMERDLGLSYPTVRARLEEALEAAGYERSTPRADDSTSWEEDLAERIRERVEKRLEGLSSRARDREDREDREADRMRRRAERREDERAAGRTEILDQLERGDLSAEEAAARLRELKPRR